MVTKRCCLWFVLFTAASCFGQSYKTCDVTMWSNESYSQSSPATTNTILYFVRVGRVNYQIARPGPEVEMNSGERIHCRVDKGYMFIRNSRGQVRKAHIVDTGQPIQNQ
ncbi:MAG TPA: hypothetical protein VFB04_16115 [Terriglobales bacterium]|nr:hypothetical protein [Terriglobales bacterium]